MGVMMFMSVATMILLWDTFLLGVCILIAWTSIYLLCEYHKLKHRCRVMMLNCRECGQQEVEDTMQDIIVRVNQDTKMVALLLITAILMCIYKAQHVGLI